MVWPWKFIFPGKGFVLWEGSSARRSQGERFWKNLPCQSWLQLKSCGGLRVWGACPAVAEPLSRLEDRGGEALCTQVGWQLPGGQQAGSAPEAL